MIGNVEFCSDSLHSQSLHSSLQVYMNYTSRGDDSNIYCTSSCDRGQNVSQRSKELWHVFKGTWSRMKMARGYYLLWRSLTLGTRWVLSCQTALMLLYCADARNRKQSSDIELLYLCLLASACSVRHVSRDGDSNVYCTSSRDRGQNSWPSIFLSILHTNVACICLLLLE